MEPITSAMVHGTKVIGKWADSKERERSTILRAADTTAHGTAARNMVAEEWSTQAERKRNRVGTMVGDKV